MKRIYFIVLNVFLVLLFASCTSVKISTIKNEQKKISDVSGYLVYCNIADMELRNTLESSIVEKFTEKGKKAKESILLFPPIREYSYTEINEKCMNEGLNAKLTISPINSSTETGYMYMYGVLMPVSSTNYSFDLILQDLVDNEIIIRSTVNTEGSSIKYIASTIAKKIVNEFSVEENKELLNLLQTGLSDLNPELRIESINSTKYTIIGKSKLGDITINSNAVILEFPNSFYLVSDEKKIAKVVKNNDTSIYQISMNNPDNLKYIVNLINEYNEVKK